MILLTYFILREKMSDSKIDEKCLKSLPKRFQPKVVIEENKDVDKLKLKKLVGYL